MVLLLCAGIMTSVRLYDLSSDSVYKHVWLPAGDNSMASELCHLPSDCLKLIFYGIIPRCKIFIYSKMYDLVFQIKEAFMSMMNLPLTYSC